MDYTVFEKFNKVASGHREDVTGFLRQAPEPNDLLVFENGTGRQVDFDLRVAAEEPSIEVAEAPRGPGRPRLGVVAREVTLLPRHWDWLNSQPGGASIALRKLVEEARKTSGDRDRIRAAQEAAYRFMSAVAGNLPGFEEASRALFAYDRRQFAHLIAAWPEDVRDYVVTLAFSDHEREPRSRVER
jgi:Uncharacterized protein conserved in bacteria